MFEGDTPNPSPALRRRCLAAARTSRREASTRMLLEALAPHRDKVLTFDYDGRASSPTLEPRAFFPAA
jgi:hypothetical protein